MSEKLLVVGNLAKDVIGNKEYYGGSAAIIALGIKRLGIDVSILSVSATDKFSRDYVFYLYKNGIDTSLIQESLDRLPVCEIISTLNDDNGRKWTDNGSESAMNHLDTINLSSPFSLVHITSVPFNLTEHISFMQSRISYEPGPRLNRDPNFLNIKTVEKSLLLFFNQEEYSVAQKSFGDLTKNKSHYPKLQALIITLGESGSQVVMWADSNESQVLSVPAFKTTRPDIDFTGAGDNYKAGFLAAFIKGRNLYECARIGTEMAFACVNQIGGVLPESEVRNIKSKYCL